MPIALIPSSTKRQHTKTIRRIGASLAGRLPANLQGQFASAAAFAEGEDPEQWARRTSGLFDLIDDPTRVLAALDRQDPREV
ncbi:hypothetical protein ACWD3Z_00805 [Streptomyces sp. NPDC002740]